MCSACVSSAARGRYKRTIYAGQALRFFVRMRAGSSMTHFRNSAAPAFVVSLYGIDTG